MAYTSSHGAYLGPGGRAIMNPWPDHSMDRLSTTPPSTLSASSPSPSGHHVSNHRHSTSSASSTASHRSRQPRPPRPSYSDEQKFFIMYARIVCGFQWATIKNHFENLWGTGSGGGSYPGDSKHLQYGYQYGAAAPAHAPRTEEGLTSVYYRVRHEWGLAPVQAGPASENDRRVVCNRASLFSREFLTVIGFLPQS